MSWGYEIGRTYNRRSEIHARLGGQQQGGIITPAKHPLVIIITGDEGLAHGYADRYSDDGVFNYFGEGQVGDMQLRAGNRAIANHSIEGKGLLLFRKTPHGLRFEGEMVCQGYHLEVAPDRTGSKRQAIVFELRTLDAVSRKIEEESVSAKASDSSVKKTGFCSSQAVYTAAYSRKPEHLPTESRRTRVRSRSC